MGEDSANASEMVELLLQAGASPDVQDKNCNSLWEAAELEGHASLGRAIVAEVEKLGRTVRRA